MPYIGRTPTNAALTASDLADGIVGTAKIAADAVTDAKIADDVVGTEHLTANEVDTSALKGDAVTGAELADNAVNSEHYTDGSIDTAHIADANVTTAKVADDAITAAKINNDIISGTTALAAEPADTDEFLVSDAGTLKRIDYSLIKGGGCWTKLNTITISGNTSQIEHEEANFTSTHRDYKIMLSNITVTADAIMRMRVGTDGGSLGSGGNYRYAMTAYKSNDATNVQAAAGGTSFVMGGTNTGTSAAVYTSNFEINLYNPLSTTSYLAFSSFGHQNDDNDYTMTHVGAGTYVTGHDVAIKRFALFLASGDFSSGTSTLYGRTA